MPGREKSCFRASRSSPAIMIHRDDMVVYLVWTPVSCSSTGRLVWDEFSSECFEYFNVESRGSRSVVCTLICSKKAPDHIRSHSSVARRYAYAGEFRFHNVWPTRPRRPRLVGSPLERSLSSKLVLPNRAAGVQIIYLLSIGWAVYLCQLIVGGGRTGSFPQQNLADLVRCTHTESSSSWWQAESCSC